MKRWIYLFSALTLAAVGGVGLLFLNATSVIIYMGVRALTCLEVMGLATVGAFGVLDGIAISKFRQQKNLLLEQEAEARQIEARKAAPSLAISSELDAVKIREMLNDLSFGNWSVLHQPLSLCIRQLDQMDEHQENLHRLLQDNGAVALNDAEDMLNQVEQTICKNMRKILNFLNVAEISDADLLTTKIESVLKDNAKLLQQAKEFNMALAQYLNEQGNNDTSAEMLNQYKTIIANEIQKS